MQRLRRGSLHFVPAEVLSDIFLCLPFTSMLELGAAYGATDDAGWCRLLGDDVWYVWAEAMVRDVDADVETFARDVIARYRSRRALPLPQQSMSLPALYRTVVLDVDCIRKLDSSEIVGERANVVLYDVLF